ncbi:MAG: biotin/lipoyl-binding protein, partial [Duncaniella sp.]|nr:biotin/lipoyl-binding protein [Duncaniella sp.]
MDNRNSRETLSEKFSTDYPPVNRKSPIAKRAWLVVALVILIIAAALYFFLQPKAQPASVPTVEVETVETSNVNIYGEYVGRIRAQQFVEIHARVEGYLESMLFKEGSYIEKGQTLFVIDPQLYKAHV